MNNPTIDEAMAYPWRSEISSTDSGGFALTVFPPLHDFVLYGATKDELERDWTDALRSHLKGYIATGKIIPIPHVRVMQPDTRGAEGGSQQYLVGEGGELESPHFQSC